MSKVVSLCLDISETETEIQDGWPRYSLAPSLSSAKLPMLYGLPFAVKIGELAISIGWLQNDLVPVAYTGVCCPGTPTFIALYSRARRVLSQSRQGNRFLRNRVALSAGI